VNNGVLDQRKRMGLSPQGVYPSEQKRQKLYSDFTVEAAPLPPSKINLLAEQSVGRLSIIQYPYTTINNNYLIPLGNEVQSLLGVARWTGTGQSSTDTGGARGCADGYGINAAEQRMQSHV
jgi:hypothetical protein